MARIVLTRQMLTCWYQGNKREWLPRAGNTRVGVLTSDSINKTLNLKAVLVASAQQSRCSGKLCSGPTDKDSNVGIGTCRANALRAACSFYLVRRSQGPPTLHTMIGSKTGKLEQQALSKGGVCITCDV